MVNLSEVSASRARATSASGAAEAGVAPADSTVAMACSMLALTKAGPGPRLESGPRARGSYGYLSREEIEGVLHRRSLVLRSKSKALTMLWPGRRTPLARNTRRYGSPVLVMPLAFSSSIRSGSP